MMVPEHQQGEISLEFQSPAEKAQALGAIQTALNLLASARESLKQLAVAHGEFKDLQSCITQLGVLSGDIKFYDAPSIWNVYNAVLRTPARIEEQSETSLSKTDFTAASTNAPTRTA